MKLKCNSALRCLAVSAIAAAAAFSVGQSKPENVKMKDISGISLGMRLAEVRGKLGAVGSNSNPGKFNARGSLKEAWILTDGPFKSIAYKASEEHGIGWVTGWVREGQGLPFNSIGDLKTAARSTDSQAIWNVASPSGHYRLVAKGAGGKASVITFFALEEKEDD